MEDRLVPFQTLRKCIRPIIDRSLPPGESGTVTISPGRPEIMGLWVSMALPTTTLSSSEGRLSSPAVL
jgi:hypothetical protein